MCQMRGQVVLIHTHRLRIARITRRLVAYRDLSVAVLIPTRRALKLVGTHVDDRMEAVRVAAVGRIGVIGEARCTV